MLGLLSIGGGLAANYFWLNPETNTAGDAGNATKTQTVTGDAIQYRYGTVQLEITASNGKLESINDLVVETTPGWEEAVPVIHEAAMQAQSADFGNVSGATFTTEAYKQALASALSKLK
ncbi:MAG: hypothetical protein RL100_213 [Actinomycetota bacterium]